MVAWRGEKRRRGGSWDGTSQGFACLPCRLDPEMRNSGSSLDLLSRRFAASFLSGSIQRGLECRFDCGVGGVSDGGGDAVLVPADALVYDRVFEAVFVSSAALIRR